MKLQGWASALHMFHMTGLKFGENNTEKVTQIRASRCRTMLDDFFKSMGPHFLSFHLDSNMTMKVIFLLLLFVCFSPPPLPTSSTQILANLTEDAPVPETRLEEIWGCRRSPERLRTAVWIQFRCYFYTLVLSEGADLYFLSIWMIYPNKNRLEGYSWGVLLPCGQTCPNIHPLPDT